MIRQGKLKLIFKCVAIIIAATFLWQQVSWAADLNSVALDDKLKAIDARQSQAFAPAYLQAQQALHEDLISQKQSIEDSVNSQYLNTPTNTISQNPEPESVELKGPRGG